MRTKSDGTRCRHPWTRALQMGLYLCLAQVLLLPSVAQLDAEEDESTNAVQIETTADALEYDRETGIVTAIGNVEIVRGDVVLTADRVRVNVDTELAHAYGNVKITRGEEEMTGQSIKYNFRTEEGWDEGGGGNIKAAPFFVESESREISGNVFVLHNATISTCKNAKGHRHFHVKARKLEVQPNTYMKTRRAVWYFGSVPSMFVPYWYKNLEDEFGWHFYPGHDSRLGFFLLSSYRYRVNPGVIGETHFDIYTERGIGVGQDFKWNFEDGAHKGDFKAYFIDDDKPVDDDEDAATSDIDSSRYRFRYHDQFLPAERDIILVRAHYLSDTDVIEDFFEDEYRLERQPDNFVSYTHLESDYTAGVIVRSRLNDFYENVNRMPEGTLDIFRRQVGDSTFFYESVSSAAFLEKVFPDSSSRDDFDSLRLDTAHTVLRPDKHFGFLTVIPRVGIRGTHYSNTRELQTVAAGVTLTSNVVVNGGVTNIVVTSSPSSNTTTRVVDGGAEFRGLIEIGFETSFKAFKVWEGPHGPRRHIVEPFANYTFIPEPSVTPDELHQFDDIDRLDEQHTIKLGVRNKYQKKKDQGPFDIIDAEVFTIVDLNTEGDEETLEDLFWDVEIFPHDYLRVDAEGQWKIADSELQQFNLLLDYNGSDIYEARGEYRYRLDDSSLFAGDLTLYPVAPWSYTVYGRYEAEESRLEEVGAQVKRTFDCLAVRTGLNHQPGFTRSDGTEKDDDYRFTVEFWLTAFPESGIGSRRRNRGI